MRLLLATRNLHKVTEISAILSIPSLALLSMKNYPDIPEVIEDGATFEANAVKKAATLARATGLWAMADDSGLEVDALGGAPGVYSARYAGEPVDYRANNRKLLQALDGNPNRRARFRCVIALSDPSGTCMTVQGSCDGRIGHGERGSNGFGYDPLFLPDGYDCTFAEMPSDLKNRISHRSAALRRACEEWGGVLANGAPRGPARWSGPQG
jgi:XTP/dITP diphosphohydrolase